MGGTRFMVQWEEHPSHLATRLGQLLEHQTLVDVTLMCNTHTLRVHRAVLAACSPYFETILQRQLGMHPLIVLKDMQFSVLKSLIEFMYCGETSVTEDNLGALLQAAKFFQVKGLSAMTKEALGLVPSPKSTVNGDAARKAFVGRPKRVGMQQTFVTSGLKTVPASHASSSHVAASTNELPTLPTKTTFQTISKPVVARPDTQQQTDTAQLLLSLSGSEFPKQTFHTVSKNVRFQHNVSGSAVSSGTVDSNAKKEVVGRIPVMATPNGGTKATSAVPQQSTQIVETATVGSLKEEVVVTNPQSVYIAEGARRRGRPVKRQMNMLFQERVMTDADMALHKEAEASRKALEMLRQEMSTDSVDSNAATSSAAAVTPPEVASPPAVPAASTSNAAPISNAPAEQLQKGLVKQTAPGSNKIQVQPVQTPVPTSSRTVAPQPVSSPTPAKRMNANVVYKTAANTVQNVSNKKNPSPTSDLPDATSNSNAVNVTFKVEESEIQQQVYQLDNEVVQEAPREESIEYQVSTETAEGEGDLSGANTNIVYQVADGSAAGSVMSQYMEVLKEAGLPTDVPILLDSGDGSYVTVNEEVLMNIVNGGVLQCHVTEGNIVAGDGVEFIVQEFTEDEMEAVAPVAEQAVESADLPKEGEEGTSEVVQNVEDAVNMAEGEAETPQVQDNQVDSENVSVPNLEEGNCIIPDMEPDASALTAAEPEEAEPEEGNLEVNEVPAETEMKCDVDGENKEVDLIKAEESEETTPAYNEAVDEAFSEPIPSEQPPDNVMKNEDDYAEGVCEVPSNEPPQEETKVPENTQENTQEDEMSVEQALQAMMGEGSDTEMEPCTQDIVQGDEKEENEESELKTVSQPMAEKSEDLHLVLRSEEGTEEDLRLVLSHEEELMKDEQASEDSENSFTLVLSPGTEETEEIPKQEAPEVPADAEDPEQQLPVESTPEQTTQLEPQSNEFAYPPEEAVEQDSKHLQVEAVSEELPPAEDVPEAAVKVEEEEELEAHNATDLDKSVPVNDASGDSQEVVHFTSNTVVQSADTVPRVASKTKGAVISPSKDIPYAVGLLPLKTALEKLQAMPEYHPRKTRSSSTGKESNADMPAARVKRKASSSDGPDKKLKMCPSEADTIVEQPSTEAAMEVVASASVTGERKEGTVLSMPELMTDSTEG